MFSRRLRIAAAVLAAFGATGIGLAAYQVPGDSQRTRLAAPRPACRRQPT